MSRPGGTGGGHALIITGLVDEHGNTRANPARERRWIMGFTLTAWREARGQVNETPLAVTLNLNKNAYFRCMRVVAPNEIVQIAVARRPRNHERGLRVEAARLIGRARSVALSRIQSSRELPQSIRDDLLGHLDQRGSRWSLEGAAVWQKRGVRVSLEGAVRSQIESALAFARSIWTDQARWTELVRAGLVRRLLKEVNTTWRLQHEPVISPDQFLDRLRVIAISFSHNRQVTFTFDPGDLFGDHFVAIRLRESGTVKDVDLI